MLMIPNEDKTAVHGCHCQGDMDECMWEVLAIQQSWYICFSAKIGIAGNSPALQPLPTHLPFTPSPLNCPSPSCHLPALHPLPAHLPFTPLPPTCPLPPRHSTALHPFASQLPFTLSPPMHPTHPVEDGDSENTNPVLDSRR